ncbi:MAG TPA: hypothetical protein VLD36_05535 [Burkholderiales bacterium]|nr:hypothetical protein [Burkholderiales bacterium]
MASTRRSGPWQATAAALLAGIALAWPPSAALGADYYKTVGGYAIYIGILPAQVVQGHAREHPEGTMHGGAPSGRHQYHLVVALFDAATGARVDDAQVTAKVGEPGLAPVEKRLEPMPIAGAMSYGNYFPIPAPGPYRIDLRVVRRGSGTPVDASFTHSHPR